MKLDLAWIKYAENNLDNLGILKQYSCINLRANASQKSIALAQEELKRRWAVIEKSGYNVHFVTLEKGGIIYWGYCEGVEAYGCTYGIIAKNIYARLLQEEEIKKQKETTVYYNVRKKCVSSFVSGEKIQHHDSIVLRDVRFIVNEGEIENPKSRTRQWTLKHGRKSVHAYAKGKQQKGGDFTGFILVGYNPYKAGYFYDKKTGNPVYGAKLVQICKDGDIMAVL